MPKEAGEYFPDDPQPGEDYTYTPDEVVPEDNELSDDEVAAEEQAAWNRKHNPFP